MVGKIKTGGFFKGAVEYISQQEKGELIHSNMLGEKPNELIKEFQTIAEANTRAQNKVKHHILSFADSDKLSDKQLRDISEKYLNEMGYKNNQFAVYKHTDTSHQHIHILTNRVDMDTYKVVNDSHEKRKARSMCMKLEKEYNLERTPERSQTVELHQNKKAYIELQQRLANEGGKKLTDKEYLDKHIRTALEQKPKSWEDLGEKLKGKGITIEMNKAKNGASFLLQGNKFKASSIARDLTFKAINKTISLAMPGLGQAINVTRNITKGPSLRM